MIVSVLLHILGLRTCSALRVSLGKCERYCAMQVAIEIVHWVGVFEKSLQICLLRTWGFGLPRDAS